MMMMMTVIIGVLGIVPEGREKKQEELKIRGRIKTILATVLLRSS